jgi:hypothetical protein
MPHALVGEVLERDAERAQNLDALLLARRYHRGVCVAVAPEQRSLPGATLSASDAVGRLRLPCMDSLALVRAFLFL